MSKDQSHKPAKAFKANNIAGLEQQIKELTDALQRERADSHNLRRRTEEERAKLGDLYKASIIRTLLPAIDSFERAAKHTPKELMNNDYIKGIQAVIKQFEKALGDLGVSRIKTIGEPFNPRFHEAVAMEDGDGQTEVVSEELQPGYRLGDEVIRHAMVKVKMI
ncbi:MAG TPA: nucleotide exchange factor GrpE [Candidatus Saccharimonadales bacterium]|jgi:molecular chaperone GrpE|nr:nucleotide exchange factor GrpE [Candidatus Saccharimonadales bacterium]